MIVVTGAAGKTGKAVIQQLLKRGENVRGIVRREAQIQELMRSGVRDVLLADMLNQQMLDDAFQGAKAVYHICPNMHPDELLIGLNAIHAAQKTGVDQFVYHSVLHPQVQMMAHHWQKMRVEEKLFESGLVYTILQPAAYMQNILGYWPKIVKTGVYTLPYDPQTRLNMVDLNDVAQAAAVVLTENGHQWATYELCGPQSLSQQDAASIISNHIGQEVVVEIVSIEQWEEEAYSSGLNEYALRTLVSMFQYYEKYGFFGNGQVLSALLGRPPRTFSNFVKSIIGDQAYKEGNLVV